MASEAHNDRKQNLLHIKGCPIDLPRKRISYSPNKNMKKVSAIFINFLTQINYHHIYKGEGLICLSLNAL